jgi:hypothetical protein
MKFNYGSWIIMVKVGVAYTERTPIKFNGGRDFVASKTAFHSIKQ